LTVETLGCQPATWRDATPQDLQPFRKRWQEWWERNKDKYPLMR